MLFPTLALRLPLGGFVTANVACIVDGGEAGNVGESAVQQPLAKSTQVGGITFDPTSPPEPHVVRRELGLVTARGINGQLVHEAEKNLFKTRATITPAGDYLLMFPKGEHYGGREGKVNNMNAYRSSDNGNTWTGPKVAFDIDYSQHGFIPLIPHGSKQIYAFGTQPIEGEQRR